MTRIVGLRHVKTEGPATLEFNERVCTDNVGSSEQHIVTNEQGGV